MSLEEKNRKLRHVKKGKDLRRHWKDKENTQWAEDEMKKYKNR